MSVVLNLEPKLLWKYFDEIRKIPRGSGNEKAIGDYVLEVAKELGLKAIRDNEGNIIIYKICMIPAGIEKAFTVFSPPKAIIRVGLAVAAASGADWR